MENKSEILPEEIAEHICAKISGSGFTAEAKTYDKFGGYFVIRLRPETYEAKCLLRYLCWPSIAISMHDSVSGFARELNLWHDGEKESFARIAQKLSSGEKETYQKYTDALEKIAELANG